MGNYIKNIFKLIFAVSVLQMAAISCSITKPVIKDSTVISYHYIDSVNYKDSTIYHHLYKEIYNDYTGLLDTLKLENTYSKSEAYIDTTYKLLKGSLVTKTDSIPIQIKWKEKIVYKDSTASTEVEVPVEVEKVVTVHPKYEIWLWLYIILSIAVLYFLIKKKKILNILKK